MKKIAIIGSRDLACKITNWLIERTEIEIVGGVFPSFKGWWDDQLETTFDTLNIKKFSTIEELISATRPDIIFSINYWKKIENDLIKLIPLGIVNIHHSYLLKFKGRYSTSWAIIHARKENCWEHGTTLHFINEHLDEGKIIASYKCKITEEDTGESLFRKVEILALQMFKDNFIPIIQSSYQLIPPAPKTYFYDINSNQNLEINPNWTEEEIYDFVRAWHFPGRPLPFIKFNSKKIYLSLNEHKNDK